MVVGGVAVAVLVEVGAALLRVRAGCDISVLWEGERTLALAEKKEEDIYIYTCIHSMIKHKIGVSLITVKSSWELFDN